MRAERQRRPDSAGGKEGTLSFLLNRVVTRQTYTPIDGSVSSPIRHCGRCDIPCLDSECILALSHHRVRSLPYIRLVYPTAVQLYGVSTHPGVYLLGGRLYDRILFLHVVE